MAWSMLLEIIVHMILISIDPFTLKRFFVILLAAIGLSSASCFGDSVLLSVRSTPYDNQMTRIQSVLASDSRKDHGDISLRMVNYWIGDLRSIPYGFSKEWKTPVETQSSTS